MIKRRLPNAFMTEDRESDYKKSICQNCYEDNVTVRLQTYPPDAQHYLICPSCGAVKSKKQLRYTSEVGVLGHVEGVGKPDFQVVSKRRGRGLERDAEGPEFEIPKLGGSEDIELKQMVADGAVIVSVTDSNVDGVSE